MLTFCYRPKSAGKLRPVAKLRSRGPAASSGRGSNVYSLRSENEGEEDEDKDDNDARSIAFGRNAAAALMPPPPLPRLKKRGPKPGSSNKGTAFRQPQNTSSQVYYGLSVAPAVS